LRLIWRSMNRLPDPEPGSRMEHAAAHIGHMALYAMMVIMVITGYAGTGVNTEYFFLFEIPKFESTQAFALLIQDAMGMTFETFEKPIDFIHKEVFGEWLAWILIAGHVGAAMYHHLVKKDRTLFKMTSGN